MTPLDKPTSDSRLRWWPFMVGGAALVIGVAFGWLGFGSDESLTETEMRALQSEMRNATLYPNASREIPAFSLVTGDNEPVDQTLFDDRWSLLFFGFTHCPDVCPLTLSVLDRMKDELPPDVAAPQIVFVSVDPQRDTPEVMAEYTGFFDESIVAVTGDMAEVSKFTRELGIAVAYTASPNDPNDYTVDHTAAVFLIDPRGRVRAKLNAPHAVEPMRDDYVALQAGLN